MSANRNVERKRKRDTLRTQIINQLPAWARPSATGIRLSDSVGGLTRRIFIRQLIATLIAFALGAAFVIAVDVSIVPRALSARVMDMLYLPTVYLQITLDLMVLVSATNIINIERRKQTWDNLRATESGIRLLLRAQWSRLVLYRFAGILTGIYLVRVVLLGLFLYDLTAFRGDYLHYLTGGITPAVSPLVGMILVALTLTGAFVLPLVNIAFSASIGLLLATFFRQRAFNGLMQFTIIVSKTVLTLFFILMMVNLVDFGTISGEVGDWLTMFAFGAYGDWGLRFMNGAFVSDLWLKHPYTVLIGVAVLITCLYMAVLAEAMLMWSIRRAQSIE